MRNNVNLEIMLYHALPMTLCYAALGLTTVPSSNTGMALLLTHFIMLSHFTHLWFPLATAVKAGGSRGSHSKVLRDASPRHMMASLSISIQ